MTLYLSKRTIFVLIIATVLFIGASYLSAWTAPAGNPPNNNVAAPINTATTSQKKTGALEALVFRSGEVWSTKYCDYNGQNCSNTPGGGGGGNFISTVWGCMFECPGAPVSCPAGTSMIGFDADNVGQKYSTTGTLYCRGVKTGNSYVWAKSAWTVTFPQSTRSVWCTDPIGTRFPDTTCPQPKPATSCTTTMVRRCTGGGGPNGNGPTCTNVPSTASCPP